MIACGGRFDTSLERLENSAFHLQDMIHSDPRLAGQMKSVDDTLLDVREEELSYIRKLSYFRHLESRGDSAWTMMGISVAKIGDNAPGFLETAILTRDFQATDGHDKIFALWNLAKDKDGLDFKMDYSEPIPTSFTKFAAAWIRQHGSLDIIAASEPVPESRDFYANAPSWCPDWTVPAKTSCLLRRDTIPKRMMRIMDDLDGAVYSADGGMTLDKASNEPFFTFEGDALYCTGIILDNIATFLGDLPAFPKDMQFPMGDPQTYFRYVTWMEKLDNFYKDSNVAIYEDPMQAAKAMFHGDLPSAWPRREENPGNCSETYPQEKYVCKPELSRYVKFFAGSYSRLEARDHVKMVLRGRTLCVTEKGYMALAPSYVKNNVAEKPWLLAILATCSVPVLMQENDDGSYKICGTCFVQGWMEGEVLKDEMGVDSPADFWSAMEGSSKLKIV
ncbi:putative heterokaryon incompatibility protein [Phaeoacremonium minimum UCRPA7]|uniref:Putative heterokaryon incompatibility protein n=1 Tax=Phaeoacremonium minimum (strain UCR-PA7) TaxID=1286976 RepID=R8B8S5_PHAM7|nr:putative heterokaryon incompatibility protein [Phaeoacremonium minimum UCRPA7]EON95709.1 putative heterokaryon incompatibility protein [Phaeoacremonium minimum UCRPA7]